MTYRLRAGLVVALALFPPWAVANPAPQRLQCSLTRVEAMVGPNFDVQSENRTIVVVVDTAPASIVVHQDGGERALGHVTITQIAMSGYLDDMSLGLQASSGNIVLQTYASNSSKAEFGTCNASPSPAP